MDPKLTGERLQHWAFRVNAGSLLRWLAVQGAILVFSGILALDAWVRNTLEGDSKAGQRDTQGPAHD